MLGEPLVLLFLPADAQGLAFTLAVFDERRLSFGKMVFEALALVRQLPSLPVMLRRPGLLFLFKVNAQPVGSFLKFFFQRALSLRPDLFSGFFDSALALRVIIAVQAVLKKLRLTGDFGLQLLFDSALRVRFLSFQIGA